MTLAKPDYLEYEDGQISKVFCQVCGAQIAGLVDRPKGSGPNINKLVSKFKRFHNYAEAKFQHTDGSFHVTNGCWKCFQSLTVPKAQEIYEADMLLMNMKPDKQVMAIAAIDTSGTGLL